MHDEFGFFRVPDWREEEEEEEAVTAGL